MANSTNIRRGNDLMVFIGEGATAEALAFATNHTLTITQETEDVQSKDSGYNGLVLPKKVTWEILSENLYIDGEYDKLFNYVNAATDSAKYVTLVWGTTTNAKSAITGDNPNLKATTMHKADGGSTLYKGKALITSLTVNANAGENATYSVTFTGTGDITPVLAS